MKTIFNLNEKEKSILKIVALSTIIICVIIGIIFYYNNVSTIIGDLFSILAPFFVGFVLAYILYRPMVVFERMLSKTKIKKGKRNLAILITFLLFGVILSLFISIIIPELISSSFNIIDQITNNYDEYQNILTSTLYDLGIKETQITEFTLMLESYLSTIVSYIPTALDALVDFIASLTSTITAAVIGFIVSIYMLANKETLMMQLKRVNYALFSKKIAEKNSKILALSNKIYGSFIIGQLTVSLILGIICFLLMTIFGIENAILISVVVGFTNIIPYIGPYIGAIPSTLIILTTNPGHAIIFVIIVIFVQQLDNTLISPRIVGSNVGLTPIWVMFALIVCGGLFGLPGLIIGTPTFAIVYTLIGEKIDTILKNKNLDELRIKKK